MKLFAPGPSFQLLLPDDITYERADRVSSFWFAGQGLLLQFSSYLGSTGEQVSACQRFEDRIAKKPGKWAAMTERVNQKAPDQAAAEFVETDEISWLHSYLVWPHLTIYATVVGPVAEVRDASSWARLGLNNIEIVLQ